MTRRRRSKVRSKTRSESSQKSEEDVVYCVCRSSDGTRFMIACDNCEEWYHGDCINVTPKQAANIKRFFCHLCVGRNPSLEIEYKTGKEERVRLPNLRQQIKKTNFSEDDENDADLSSSSSPDKSLGSAKRAMRKRWRPISESVGKKRRGRPKERQEDYDDEATEDEIETSGFVPSIEENIESGYCGQVYRGTAGMRINTPTILGRGNVKVGNRTLMDTTKGCGICEACKLIDDCGQCDVCSHYNMSPRNICRKRRCMSSNYRGQMRKSYVSKTYGSINDDFDAVYEDPEYHRPVRRRNDFEIGEIRQRLTNPVTTNKNPCTVGSKMRRGDHLPGGGNSTSQRRSLTSVGMPYKCFEEDSLEVINGSSFRYHQGSNNRLSRNQIAHPLRRTRTESDAAATANMSSNTSSVSGRMSSHQYAEYQYAEESEEDVMIPGELISPTNGQKFSKETYSKTEYGLSYQDHLYCKHHRSFNLQGSMAPDNSMSSSDLVTASCTALSSKQSDQDLELRPPSPGHHFIVIERPMKAMVRSTPNDLRHNRKSSNIKTVGSLSSEKRLVMSDPMATPDSLVTRLFNEESYQMVDLNESLQSTNDLKLHKSNVIDSPLHPNPTVTSSIFSLKTPKTNHTNTTQDFYTINDEDDLEINWPKDTVNV